MKNEQQKNSSLPEAPKAPESKEPAKAPEASKAPLISAEEIARIKADARAEVLAELEAANAGKVRPTGLMNGNKDESGEYPFPADWQDQVVVWQCKIEQMNSGVVEVPNTHMMQTYSPETYDKLSNADLKQSTSFFSESKMKVVVLHDPRG